MNYYEHHIGDYAAATSHLSPLEDGVYSRLIRIYYRDEKPLPLDLKAVQRLVGARTREEKEAVDQVLNEFFQKTDEGWRNKRCDEEITKVLEKREKARRSAEARWSASKSQCERIDSGMRSHPRSNANASETHDERNALHTPITSHQSPDVKQGSPSTTGQAPGGDGTPAGRLAAALNRAGIRITSHDVRLIAAADAGITAAEVIELRGLYPDKPAAYLLKAAETQRAEGANGAIHAARPASRRLSPVQRVQASIERRQNDHREPEPPDDRDVLEGEAVRVAN